MRARSSIATSLVLVWLAASSVRADGPGRPPIEGAVQGDGAAIAGAARGDGGANDPTAGREDAGIAPTAEQEDGAFAPAGRGPEDAGTHWRPWWPRFHLVEGIVTIAAEGAAVAIYVAEPYREARWLDPAPLDSELRDGLRLRSTEDRGAVVLTSDVIFYGLLVWPVLVDALFLAGLVHGDTDSMLQMALIDLEVLAIAHLVHWLTTRVVGRVRPLHRECAADDSCHDRGVGPVASFVSGHSLLAYAASGLVCTHHLFNPWLTGSSEGAAIACGSSLALATATSLMRVMVDLHWASDVGIGAVIGASIGWVLPIALHYAHGPPASSDARGAAPLSLAVRPGAGDELTGLTITGAF